jgi:hypothetical protein
LSKKRVRGLHASWLVASPFALLLLALAVGTATANHQQGHLSDPSVAPRQVAAGATVTVAVTFTDGTGAAPKAVAVAVDRTVSPMTAGSGSFQTGVHYETTVAPTAGRHAIIFTATDAGGDRETIWAGYIQVEGGDTPEPSADATVAPTRSPTPEPTARSTPAPTPVAGGGGTGGKGKSGSGDDGGGATPAPGGGSPVPSATPAQSSGASPDPTGTAQTGRNPGAATTSGPSAGGQDGNEEPACSTDPSAGDGQTIDPSTELAAGSNGAAGAVDESQGPIVGGYGQAGIDLLASYHASLPALLVELVPTIATATTGGLAWAAFVIFGKRRRDGDDPEPDLRLAAAAATGVDTGAAQGLRVVDESQLPRWRRPSLQQVRRTDPLRVVAEAPTMSFAGAGAGVRPLESYERRYIRYRLVRLLNCPDEVRASEIGILDRGDEVQLLERLGVYWRVLCPDGRTGWVHRMTLSAPASEDASEAAEAVEAVEPACEPDFDPVEPVCETSEAPVETAAAAPETNVDCLLEVYMRARSDVLHSAEEVEAVGATEVEPEPEVQPTVAVEPKPAVGPAVAALARDYLERAGFAVVGPEPAAQPAAVRAVEGSVEPVAEPAVGMAAATAPVGPPSSDVAPAAEQERADGRYSGHRTGDSRKASAASLPGTRSHRPSR